MVVVGSYFNTSRCPQRVGVVQISFLFSVSKKQPHTRSRACYSRRNIRDLRSHGDLEALQRFVHGKLDRHKKKFTRRNNCNKSLSKPAAVLRTHTCVYIYMFAYTCQAVDSSRGMQSVVTAVSYNSRSCWCSMHGQTAIGNRYIFFAEKVYFEVHNDKTRTQLQRLASHFFVSATLLL